MNKYEAAFVISEIRNYNRYESMLISKRAEMKKIQDRIADMATPKSANGGVTIKPMTFYPDGTVKSMGEQFSSKGNGPSKESKLIELITEEEQANDDYNKIRIRQQRVKGYIEQIKDKTNQDKFMIEFMNGKPYNELEEIYNYSNPYKRAISILKGIDIEIF